MLKAFLIALVACLSIAVVELSLNPPSQYQHPPGKNHSKQTSENKKAAAPKFPPSILKIECDPNCRSTTGDDEGDENWGWSIIKKTAHDPIAIFNAVLCAFTGLLVWVSARTIQHFRVSERAYFSGGGVGANLILGTSPITYRRGREIIAYTRNVVGGYFEVHINNYGKTPGELLEIGVGFCDAALPIPETPQYDWQHFNGWFGPGTHGHPLIRAPIPAGFQSPAVYGRFRFRDIYGKKRTAGFILEITHFGSVSVSAPSAYTESD